MKFVGSLKKLKQNHMQRWPVASSIHIQHRIVDRIEFLLADLREAQSTLESMQQDIDHLIDSMLLEVFNETVTRNWPNRNQLGQLIAIRAHQVNPQDPNYKQL